MKKINLKEAISIVKNGGIIIFPTDTAFGIGCRIDDQRAVERLYELRKRPQNKAVPVLFSSIAQVKKFVEPFDEQIENIMERYWPGALTIVLKCRTDKVYSLVRGGGNTLGVRVPDDEGIRRLIRGVEVPIVGTSANFARGKTPFDPSELNPDLVNLVDGVLEGKVKLGNSSTVIDSTQNPWKVLRQGAIDINL